MKLSEIKRYQGQCFPQTSIQSEISDQITCMICYEIMVKPVSLSCSARHTFGMACINQWMVKKQSISCPYCRQSVNSWQINKQLSDQLQKVKCVCNLCHSWEGCVSKVDEHRLQCNYYLQLMKKQLQIIVKQQIMELDIQINPHLKEKHLQIFQTYVKNWIWLYDDQRDWKWWWWCSNPWWNNISCQKCNDLWHKYQKKIDLLQGKRVLLVLRNKFIQNSRKKQTIQQKKEQMKNQKKEQRKEQIQEQNII